MKFSIIGPPTESFDCNEKNMQLAGESCNLLSGREPCCAANWQNGKMPHSEFRTLAKRGFGAGASVRLFVFSLAAAILICAMPADVLGEVGGE
jgi:hypothetical protein